MQTYPGDPAVRVSANATFEADGYRTSELAFGSHAGTHVDAPSHVKQDGDSLDAFPLDRFVLDALVVDCRDVGARRPIPPSRVPDATADCVVFHTGWDDHWGTDRYLDHPYLDPETAMRCADRDLDVGVDTLSPDPTPSENARGDEPTGHQSHHALLGAEQLIVENLSGIEQLPERFELQVFPLPFDGDGAPVRAVGVPGR